MAEEGGEMKHQIKNRWTGEVIYEGEAETLRDLVATAVKAKVSLRGSDLSGSDLRGSDLRDSDLSGSDLSGSDLRGVKIKRLAVFVIYKYQTWAVISETGDQWVRMGCHFRTRKDWDADFWNNNSEFPNDGRESSELRKLAYETACKWLDLVSKGVKA
jgi:hypothetical protein